MSVARPPRGAEQLTEEHLGVAGRHRCATGLIVVAGVVEEGHAEPACGVHHRQPFVLRQVFERLPGPERQARHHEVGPPEGAQMPLPSPQGNGERTESASVAPVRTLERRGDVRHHYLGGVVAPSVPTSSGG